MPDFLNIPTILGILLSLSGTVFLIWGSSINSNKSTQEIILNSNDNTKEIIKNNIATSSLILNKINNDDLIGAISLFNTGDLTIKKGVIIDLKNKAIANVSLRQKIVDFLGSLNDWITEDSKYQEILLNPSIEWTKWKMDKELFKFDDKVFEKEKQVISIVASTAIDEIIFEHIKSPTNFILNFYQKNLLGILIVNYDFKFNNIDFSKANLFGAYFWGTRNISQTGFEYATYYGSTLFRDMEMPRKIYVGHELGTKYLGELEFLKVNFPNGVGLTNSYFKENVDFVGCVFGDEAVFYISHFEKPVRFSHCYFNGKAGFNSAKFISNVSFESSKFFSGVQFVTVDFLEEVDFKNTTFVIAPNFDKTNMDNVKDLNLN
ncbi:hypothetical protein E9993_16960 [Labilibacter sediminis]|nr:hypothetical protein E9993_16960 [Labilibacter sediminis]